MVFTRVAGFILEIGDTAPIPANDRVPRWKPPSTGSRPPSEHPLPAHERAAQLLVMIELLSTPERYRMARQNAPNMVRMGSPDGRTWLRLRGGGSIRATLTPVTKISARVRHNRAWAFAGRAPNQSALKPEHGSPLTKVERTA